MNNCIFYFKEEYLYQVNDEIFYLSKNGKLHKEWLYGRINPSYIVLENVYTFKQAKQTIKKIIENSVFR